MVDIGSRLDRRHAMVAAVLFLAFVIGAVSQLTGGPGVQEATTDSYHVKEQSADLAAAGGARTLTPDDSTDDRKKATRMNLELEVPDVEEAQSQTREIVDSYGGYVTSSYLKKDPDVNGRLEVKAPEDNTSAFLSEVEGSWKVESRNVDTEDVTDRYTELELELRNKHQELQRLEELVNQTEEVESLVKIQERMSELRSRIQYLENQLEQLDRRVDYTTISISYGEPQPFHTEFDLRESFRDAYSAVFQSLNLLIVGLGYLLPFLLAGAIIYKAANLLREVDWSR